jgi:hypothetical protein
LWRIAGLRNVGEEEEVGKGKEWAGFERVYLDRLQNLEGGIETALQFRERLLFVC